MFEKIIKLYMRIKNKWGNDYIILAGVIFITALSYLSTLKNHMVADSWVFLFPHTFNETLGYFFKSIIPPEWESLWLRPIPMLFYWLDNVIWPNTEWGPHLTNVFFHILNVCLIWLLIRFINIQSKSSKSTLNCGLSVLSACILYGLHPLNVGSVGWVAARFDVMSVTFGLAGMLTWLKWDAGIKSALNITLSCLLLMSAILSKEQGIVFLVVCFVFGLYRILTIENGQKKYWKGLTILSLLTITYMIYRFSIFHGIGGYLISKQGFSLGPPIAYFITIFFPYLNLFPNWTFSLTFLATSFFIITLIIFMWFNSQRSYRGVKRIYIFSAATLFVFGLATTAPHSSMDLNNVMGHLESRFALIAISGISLLIGSMLNEFARSQRGYQIILIITLIWGLTAAWRTDIQIQAWRDAGETAHQIISEVLNTVPDPPENSQILFFGIPRDTGQFAYIFGIGLEEAILSNYPGRNDIVIIPKSQGNDLDRVRPERDYVFAYNKKSGKLERLMPRNIKK